MVALLGVEGGAGDDFIQLIHVVGLDIHNVYRGRREE